MFEVSATQVGQVQVSTTSGRGHTPDELAQMCADKIISIADTCDPALQLQARAFKERIKVMIEAYMLKAIISDRTTVFNALSDAGYPELAEHIRSL